MSAAPGAKSGATNVARIAKKQARLVETIAALQRVEAIYARHPDAPTVEAALALEGTTIEAVMGGQS